MITNRVSFRMSFLDEYANLPLFINDRVNSFFAILIRFASFNVGLMLVYPSFHFLHCV